MLFSSLFRSDGSVSDLANPKKWLTDWARGGRGTASGEAVNPATAMGLSAYYACIRVISEDVGKLPLKVYRQLQPRGKEIAKEHPAYRLLHDAPNEEMSAMTFRETLTAWAQGWGDGVARIRRMGGGEPESLWPVHPSNVTIRRDADQRLYYHLRYTGRGGRQEDEDVGADEVLHIHGLGDDGIRGYSVATLLSETIGRGLAARKFGASFFRNGTAMSGIMYFPGPKAFADQNAEDAFKEQWKKLKAGAENVGSVAFLGSGYKYERIGIPPDEAQYIETEQFSVEDVCRGFRMPPHKIQHLLHATFSNIEHQAIEYVVDTLTPWLVRWEQEIQRKLFGRDGEAEFFARHVLNGLLRGDSQQRAEYYNKRFSIGTLSQNDIRELEDENPIGPEGDTYYVPMNMERSEDAAEGKNEDTGDPPPGRQIAPPPGPQDQEGEEDSQEPPVPAAPEEEEESPEAKALSPEAARRAMAMVFRDAAARVTRKEALAVDKAAEKHKGNPQKFAEWADDFFDANHLAFIEATFAAPLEAVAELRGTSARVLEEAATAAIELHVSRSKPSAASAHGFVVMSESRATELADAVMTEILR